MSLPLLQAAEARLLDDVIELVTEGASVNYQNPDQSTEGHTALIEATLNLDIPMMRWLLENGALVNAEDYHGLTAINHLYTEYVGNNETDLMPALELLHEFHAALEHPNHAEDSFIQWAAFNGHIGIVTYLLGTGIDPNTAIDDAREGENPAMITLLENAIADRALDNLIGSELDDEVGRIGFNHARQ
ncbi:MAG: hypothetical protein KBB94_04525 [Legionellaceae bacterium]|nr:hypothetical protein [Legionellaceae bacterium]MBP9775463.1 hypothetical protein [Legionellaceae bacterium]